MKESFAVSLVKIQACPFCGFRLAVSNVDEIIACPRCGEEVDVHNLIPLTADEAEIKPIVEDIPEYSGSLEPLSVHKFIEKYYADIATDQAGVEIDLQPIRFLPLIRSLELTKGDNKATWMAKFMAYYKPFERKLFAVEEAEALALNLYNGNKLKPLSVLFEQIRESISELLNLKDAFLDMFNECIGKTGECDGVLPSDLESMNDLVTDLTALLNSKKVPENLFEIEDIAASKASMDASLAAALLSHGINANANYNSGRSLLFSGQYAQAIEKLKPLGLYKDSALLVEDAKRWAHFNGELLYLGGKPYLIFKHDDVAKETRESPIPVDLFDFFHSSSQGLDLYPVVGDEPDYVHPLLLNFRHFLACYGDTVYYISDIGKISSLNCLTGEKKVLDTTGYKPRPDLFYQTVNDGEEGILLVEATERNAIDPNRNFFRLLSIRFGNLSAPIHVYNNPIDNLRNLNDHMGPCHYPYVCAARAELTEVGSTILEKTHLDLIDLATGDVKTDFLPQNGEFVDGDARYVYYAAYKPSKYNLDVYQKDFATGGENLLVSNAYKAVTVVEGKLYYTVGNRHKQTLYVHDCASHSSTLVMDRFDGYGMGSALSDHFYFYRGEGLNRTLMRTDGGSSKAKPVAMHVSPKEGAFAQFKGGYFYYVDAFDKLCRVCLDGEHYRVIAKDIDRILKVDSRNIYFLQKETVDEQYNDEEKREGKKYRISYSVYRYELLSDNVEKLIFNVENAEFFDEKHLLVYKTDDVVFRTTNLKPKNNFNVRALIREYVLFDLDLKTEKVLATFGKPHGKKGRKVLTFAPSNPVRPYVDDRDIVKVYYKGKR